MMTKRQLKVWSKLILIAVVLLSLIIFMIQNSEQVEISFLIWGPLTVPKFSLVLSTAGLTLILAKVIGGIGRLIREARALVHETRARAEAVSKSQPVEIIDKKENQETQGTP